MNVLRNSSDRTDHAAIRITRNTGRSSSNCAKVGVMLQIAGEGLAEAMELRPVARVLDVAAGNGNATLAFARRMHEVTSTDHAPDLLELGRARAAAEGLDVTFQVADAEDLPFADGAFDAASAFGVMFAPDQERAASELLRVCRPGGRIGTANWTGDGFMGRMLATIGNHVAPPPGLRPAANWGDRDWIEAAFAPHATAVSVALWQFIFRFPSPARFIAMFRDCHGPMRAAFLALSPTGQAALERDLIEMIGGFNRARDGAMWVAGDYVEVIVDKA